MRIQLFMDDEEIGHLDFDLINPWDMMGEFEGVQTDPPELADVIRRKIETNEDGVVVKGGFSPGNLCRDYHGVYLVLCKLQKDWTGFRFEVPPDEDPMNLSVSEEQRNRIH